MTNGAGRRLDVRDLGDLAGPLLVYEGPLSNEEALTALFAEAGTARAPEPFVWRRERSGGR